MSVVLRASADGWANESQPSTNYAQAARLWMNDTTGSDARFAYLFFALPAGLLGSTILEATLRVYLSRIVDRLAGDHRVAGDRGMAREPPHLQQQALLLGDQPGRLGDDHHRPRRDRDHLQHRGHARRRRRRRCVVRGPARGQSPTPTAPSTRPSTSTSTCAPSWSSTGRWRPIRRPASALPATGRSPPSSRPCSGRRAMRSRPRARSRSRPPRYSPRPSTTPARRSTSWSRGTSTPPPIRSTAGSPRA